jgi:DNA-binding HxlR family transcriptional regulator
VRVTVYVPARHERRLRAEGTDPAVWVRALVRWSLDWKEAEHERAEREHAEVEYALRERSVPDFDAWYRREGFKI